MSANLFPADVNYLRAIRGSCHALRIKSGISVERSSVERLLISGAFTSSFSRVSKVHGLAFPLQFPSVVSELNLLSVLSLLNFASGYRVPLHEQTGRGAWDNIRALVFSLYITSSTDTNWLSAKGMQAIGDQTIAEQMRVSVHVERPHESIPGVTVGEIGGPIHQLVQLITKTLNETGDVLVKGGYPDLGTFVLEALKNGQRAAKGRTPDVNVVLDQIIRAIPGFRDMSLIDGEPVYCFKKALFLLHAINIRFGGKSSIIPVPGTSSLPVFSDNVLPSMLIHLGVLDVSNSSLSSIFPDHSADLEVLLSRPDSRDISEVVAELPKDPPIDGPTLTQDQAYTLRAAAIDACEVIVEVAHSLEASTIATPGVSADTVEWMKKITLPDIDMWLWAVAKDRPDYRRLGRFVLRDTVMF